ncbi:MAG: hypothetical protein BWY71_02143 [Planctomycetes bacterium ADurb.Bin412]|nr:MAG: hypothetical protein BWY71_02143 [Planctomycetes bacterium ADurb.Bin412]
MSLAEEGGRLVWKGLENLAAKDAVQYIERAGDMPFRVETGLTETENSFWKIQGSQMREVTVGGRPAVELDFVLAWEGLQAHLQIVAHPGTAILRQRVELRNSGSLPVKLSAAVPFQMYLGEKFFPSMTNYWLFGGTNTADQGVMQSADMGASYQNVLPGENTGNFVPWMGFLRKEGSRDGWFAALDWLGRWTLGVERRETAEKEEEADTYTSDFNGCHRISKSAENSMYPSPVGNQRIHLIRAADGTQEVIWKSLVVPREVEQGESYTFQWLAATGYQSQPQGSFTLFLGDEPLLDFQVTQASQKWTGKKEGVVLDYDVTTANGEDSMGTMRLTVPAALLTAGKRAVLRVAASNSASRQWFGIYDYPCLRGGEAFFTSGTDDLSGYELKPGQTWPCRWLRSGYSAIPSITWPSSFTGGSMSLCGILRTMNIMPRRSMPRRGYSAAGICRSSSRRGWAGWTWIAWTCCGRWGLICCGMTRGGRSFRAGRSRIPIRRCLWAATRGRILRRRSGICKRWG